MNIEKNMIVSSIFGLAVGDALGVPGQPTPVWRQRLALIVVQDGENVLRGYCPDTTGSHGFLRTHVEAG